MPAANEVLHAAGIVAGYRHRRRATVVVPATNLAVRPGELVCLLGPNGAGKSTLLRTLSGVQPALDGEVHLLGDPVSTLDRRERARRLASVLTERVTVGQLAGWDLVAIGRHPHTGWGGALNQHDRAVVDDAIAAVGADHLAARFVDELSDGERQRLMIARAVAQEPALLILDEPTAFLDVTSRIALGVLLQRLAHERGLGVICSTHDLDLALATADTIWLLASGRPFRVGAPEDLALAGAIGEVFATAEVAFDPRRGTFSRRPDLRGRAVVDGEDLAAELCRRALGRIGYDTTDSDAPTDVRVVVHARPLGADYELVRTTGTPQRCRSIAELCAELRHSAF